MLMMWAPYWIKRGLRFVQGTIVHSRSWIVFRYLRRHEPRLLFTIPGGKLMFWSRVSNG